MRENETLVGRLVDRPLRPMIPKGWAYDTQVNYATTTYTPKAQISKFQGHTSYNVCSTP